MIGTKQKNPCSGKEQGFYKRIDKIEKRGIKDYFTSIFFTSSFAAISFFGNLTSRIPLL